MAGLDPNAKAAVAFNPTHKCQFAPKQTLYALYDTDDMSPFRLNHATGRGANRLTAAKKED
ncbi:hypothetical protein [Bradyrhizobium sp. AZCC 2289]|uniref:hypothetical protein n=1 Tax=Bradyrhizobium sp. AZCC 2289 TaxID=3117026 RepID=UPI002FEF16D4